MSLAAGRERLGAPTWRGLVGPAIATLCALAVLIGLGWWQLERKAWKESLLAQISARAYSAPGEPVPEPEWPRWRAEQDEFRRVRVEGTYLADKAVAVHGLAEHRRGQPLQGVYLFMPLRRGDGSVIMVNRGFVPTEAREETAARLREAPRRASVVGLVRAPERRGWFVPGNDPGKERWFVRSIGEMAAARRLERVAPFYIDAEASGGPDSWPRGGQTRLALPNNHLQYALTWFGLAVTLVAVFVAFVRARLRRAVPPSADQLQPDDPR